MPYAPFVDIACRGARHREVRRPIAGGRSPKGYIGARFLQSLSDCLIKKVKIIVTKALVLSMRLLCYSKVTDEPFLAFVVPKPQTDARKCREPGGLVRDLPRDVGHIICCDRIQATSKHAVMQNQEPQRAAEIVKGSRLIISTAPEPNAIAIGSGSALQQVSEPGLNRFRRMAIDQLSRDEIGTTKEC